mgnify:CR=1 FL=1
MAIVIEVEFEEFFRDAAEAVVVGLERGLETSNQPGVEMLRGAGPSKTGRLKAGWSGQVERTTDGADLIFRNSVDYSSFVDAKDPFVETTLAQVDERQVRPNVDDKLDEAFREAERR